MTYPFISDLGSFSGHLGRLFIFLLLCFQSTCLQAESLSIDIQAESAILINAETGAVLFEKAADEQHYPASTTKIATTLYALEQGGVPLDRMIPVEKEAIGSLSQAAKKRNQYRDAAYLLEPDGVGLGLKVGQQMRLQDLLYAVLLESANDASNVLAQYLGGSISQYMKDVNLYLEKIGCKATNFLNPHGLHHPKHLSTARDLAILTQAALRHPLFCEIIKTIHYTGKINGQEPRAFLQKNKLLRKGPYYYKKAIGVKTGYHAQAKHALVAAASEGKRTLIAVLLKNADRSQMFLDAARLFEKAFQEPLITQTLFKAGKQPYSLQLEGSRYPVQTMLALPVVLQFYPSERVPVHAEIHWSATHLPVTKDSQVGEIRLYANQRLVQAAPLLAVETVETTLIYQLAHTLQKIPLSLWAIFCMIILLLCCLFFKKR